mmetsp:Transcript_1148/g.2473  ORF Transcript_1148/g.2473 Transcript_1148/m.2473 type:complete len:215 (-) Transcript_1148:172-816(-)
MILLRTIDAPVLNPLARTRKAAHRTERSALDLLGLRLDGLLHVLGAPLRTQFVERLQPASGQFSSVQEVLSGHALSQHAPHASPACVARPAARLMPRDKLHIHRDRTARPAVGQCSFRQLQNREATGSKAANGKLHALRSLILTTREALRLRSAVLNIAELHIRVLHVEEDAWKLVRSLGYELPHLLGSTFYLLSSFGVLDEPEVRAANGQVSG